MVDSKVSKQVDAKVGKLVDRLVVLLESMMAA